MVFDAATVTLILFVLLAFTTEAALGFGATLVTVTLGSLVMPVDVVLPAFVPINVLLSMRLGWANREHMRLDIVFRRILPLMAIGLPVGIIAFAELDAGVLVRIFGAFVVALALLELWRARRPQPPSQHKGTLFEGALLVLGGIVHGAFGTGGPMVVYVSGRLMPNKAEFRATLAALWLILNLILFVSHVVGGRFTTGSAWLAAAFIPALLLGLVFGNALHHKIPAERFRPIVFVTLAIAGLVLVLR